VISVCFSWALGPNISYSTFSLAVVTVCLNNTIVAAEKAKKCKIGSHQLLVDDDDDNDEINIK